MLQVIDFYSVKPTWASRYPELAELGEGVVAVVDVASVVDAPDLIGRAVRVTRPDGSLLTATVHARLQVVESVPYVLYYFRGLDKTQIPRGSRIAWDDA